MNKYLNNPQFIAIFIRYTLAVTYLSAVADRFGIWPADISAWGNWENFVAYTAILNPWFPENVAFLPAIIATVAEFVIALMLLAGFKTRLAALCSGFLLLLFALAMSFTTGVKGALDYSVLSAAGASFGLAVIENFRKKIMAS